MKNDIFHLVTVKDGVSDSDAIIKIFTNMAEKRLKSDIRLLNYYDEVPVTYGAAISAVENDSIEVSVHEYQAVVMKNENSTLIKSRHFHNELGVHCYATYVNIQKKIAILRNFAYAQIRAERREAVRVMVRDFLPITFRSEAAAFEGSVIDISLSGVAVKHHIHGDDLSNTMIQIEIVINNTPLKMPGSLVRSLQYEDSHISIFQIKPGRMADNIISQFIYQRQVDIIQQLKEGFV